jgi:hypothetical protein
MLGGLAWKLASHRAAAGTHSRRRTATGHPRHSVGLCVRRRLAGRDAGSGGRADLVFTAFCSLVYFIVVLTTAFV